jgi:hypothetical protein
LPSFSRTSGTKNSPGVQVHPHPPPPSPPPPSPRCRGRCRRGGRRTRSICCCAPSRRCAGAARVCEDRSPPAVLIDVRRSCTPSSAALPRGGGRARQSVRAGAHRRGRALLAPVEAPTAVRFKMRGSPPTTCRL